MVRAGDAFHKFVANIEEIIKKNQFFIIKSHEQIPDKTTGGLREHDIILEYDDGNHSFQIAIECKDWKKKVDSPVIEAFITKLEDTGINKGIVVSSHGFSSGALSKAKGHDIECWSLSEAESFDWCQMNPLEYFKNILLSGYIGVTVKGQKIQEKFKLYQRFPNGRGNKEVNIEEFANTAWKNIQASAVEVETQLKIIINNVGNFYIITESGNQFELENITITTRYKTERELIPFKFHEYKDVSKDKAKKQIASAPIQLGNGMTAKLVISMGEDGGNVSMIFERE